MTPIKHISRGNTKNAWTLFGVLASAAALSLLLINLGVGNLLLTQIILMLSLIAAAYVMIRYVTAAFLYEVIDEEGGAYFLVVRLQGKKAITQVKLPLAALRAVVRAGKNEAKIPVNNYSPVLFAEDDTLLYFEAESEKMLLKIHASADFLTALAALAPEAWDALPEGVTSTTPARKSQGPYDLSDLESPVVGEPDESDTRPLGPYDLPETPECDAETEQAEQNHPAPSKNSDKQS